MDTLLLLPDRKHSEKEQRLHALGKTEDGRLLHVTFTILDGGTLIRVISAIDMYHKDGEVLWQSQKEDSWVQNGS